METRIKAAGLDRRPKSARVALVVIVSLALSLLPLRALCELKAANPAQTMDAHQTGHGESRSDLCCTSIDDSALVNSLIPTLSGGPSALFVALLVSTLVFFGFVVQPLRLAGAPPPSRSYYARSSRILR